MTEILPKKKQNKKKNRIKPESTASEADAHSAIW